MECARAATDLIASGLGDGAWFAPPEWAAAGLPAPVRAPVELALERRVLLEARRAVEAAGLATAFAAGDWAAAAGRALGAAAGGVELAAAAKGVRFFDQAMSEKLLGTSGKSGDIAAIISLANETWSQLQGKPYNVAYEDLVDTRFVTP